jgi:hypothetical protein
MREMSKDNLLRSWKEISAYLGCDTRTCHRWEQKHGMPVHRAEGGIEVKSPVFAYKDELDAWFRETFKNSSRANGKAWPARPYPKWAWGAAAVLLLAAAVFLIPWRIVRRQPADFSVKGSVLIVRDEGGRELWRWDTKMENLLTEDFYRRFFQVMHRGEGDILPSLVIRDINNDGDSEVVFAPKRVSNQTGEGRLYCFDRKGRELWEFRAGKELLCGGKVFSPDYRVAGFYCHDMDGDGRLETVVESFQAPDWPCQLAVLDASGMMIGEFWNVGYLRQLAYQDINGDGREELIVVGLNNEYKGGCVTVFDTRRISGSSPQSGRYVCEGLEPGSELYYVTVPYTDVSEAMGVVVEGLSFIDITANGRIRATYGPSLFYEFGFDLKCLQVYWGHGYEYWHGEMAKAGKLASVLDDAYRDALLKGIRYWNGSEWTAGPAKNSR